MKSERPDGVLDLPGERLVILTLQRDWGAEHDPDPSGRGHPGPCVKRPVRPFEADGDDRHAEARADHADARPERVDLAGVRPAAFREDQYRKSVSEQLANIPQCLPRAGL